jgi:tetratricopeptide (TPR) repeat protein
MRFASISSRIARFAIVVCTSFWAGSFFWADSAFAQETAPATEPAATGSAPAYPECTTKPTEGDTAAAKGAFQAGTAAYNEADYPRAINYWEDAFRRDCTATALLLNLARAYESSNQFEKAIVALRTFNERNPDSAQHDQIERRIERLEEQLKAQASQPVPPPTQEKPATTPEQPAPQPPADNQASTTPNKWPLVIAISGGAIALVGLAAYGKAKADEKEVLKQCGGSPSGCVDAMGAPRTDLIDKGNTAVSNQKKASGLAIAGAVIGVAGGVWYFFEVKRANRAAEQQASVHFVPLVSPEFAGLSLDGHF